MKPAIPITLIIVGALIAMAPLTYGFILQALDEAGGLDQASRQGCMLMGALLIGVGVVLSVFSQKSGGNPAK